MDSACNLHSFTLLFSEDLVMPVSTAFYLASPSQNVHPHLPLVEGRPELRCTVAHRDCSEVDVGTTVAKVLIIDPLPHDTLHLLPASIATFLLRHSRRGYCPPIPALRRLGFRTQFEIHTEISLPTVANYSGKPAA